MPSLTLADMASRTTMAKKRWTPKKDFHPGGEKGKLHRELGIPAGEKIPAVRLKSAVHSSNPEIKRDAIRVETMKGWHHGGAKKNRNPLYTHPRSHKD